MFDELIKAVKLYIYGKNEMYETAEYKRLKIILIILLRNLT